MTMNFMDEDEFIDCIDRGCEVNFAYDGKEYVITRVNDQVSICECDTEANERGYDTAREALEYPVGNKRLGDILQDVEMMDRTLY